MSKITTEKELLEDLERRADITYRIRTKAAERLRTLHDRSKKYNIFCSILIAVASILSINIDDDNITKLVLVSSIALTYYMMYISEQNYQERAYRMEESFKQIDVIRNKTRIALVEGNYVNNPSISSKLYKEYEQAIIRTENHLAIDYTNYNYCELLHSLNSTDSSKLHSHLILHKLIGKSLSDFENKYCTTLYTLIKSRLKDYFFLAFQYALSITVFLYVVTSFFK